MELDNITNPKLVEDTDIAVHIRAPKRILHFSDGTIEEYSDDEEDTVDGMTGEQNNNLEVVNEVNARNSRKFIRSFSKRNFQFQNFRRLKILTLIPINRCHY